MRQLMTSDLCVLVTVEAKFHLDIHCDLIAFCDDFGSNEQVS